MLISLCIINARAYLRLNFTYRVPLIDNKWISSKILCTLNLIVTLNVFIFYNFVSFCMKMFYFTFPLILANSPMASLVSLLPYCHSKTLTHISQSLFMLINFFLLFLVFPAHFILPAHISLILYIYASPLASNMVLSFNQPTNK